MGKKELASYPPLGFKVGKFIRDKVVMNDAQTEVLNTLYYENCKIQRDYYFSAKKRKFETEGSVYTKMDEMDILRELAELEDVERDEEKAQEELRKVEGELVRRELEKYEEKKKEKQT